MRIEVKQLGLAAYLKINGSELLEVTNDGKFVFETDKSFQEWRIQYLNSCCFKHDNELCQLRSLLQ